VRRLVAVLVLLAALVTVAGLYAAGPRWKNGRRDCRAVNLPIPPPNGDMVATNRACSRTAVRTNAWERVEGAVTGSP
jgi:hypothetical protein